VLDATNCQTLTILGVRVDCTSYPETVERIVTMGSSASHGYVCVGNVHMVMEAFDDPIFRQIVNNSVIVTPDGMPLVWGLRLLGSKCAQRVYGPTLTLVICEKAAENNLPVGFYGGTPEVIAQMTKNLKTKFPSLNIAYAYSPPFHELSEEEDRHIVTSIIASGVRILFVGLGCPKQERWMAQHVNFIPGVLVGVGAAFDFIAGSKPQAPPWLQNLGMEWFFRLVTEPKRLWKRYLYHNPRFVLLFAKQLLYQRHSKTTEP
jgi:N-acetylglucosaminyldiphosphoundecaprenol N-acetyl-beta-D-mannosaminyltransferase